MSNDKPQNVPEALEEGYKPVHTQKPPDDGEWAEYAWGHIPCPHCDAGMLIGIYDPDHALEHEPARMAILAPPEHDRFEAEQ